MNRTHRNWKQRTEDNLLSKKIDRLLAAQQSLELVKTLVANVGTIQSLYRCSDLYHMTNNISKELDKLVETISKDVATLLNPSPSLNENLDLMKALNTMIDDHFGVYISRPTKETSYITFMPEDKLAEVIPAEYAPKVNELARVFTEKVNRFAAELDTLDDVPDNVPEDVQEQILKKRFKRLFKAYKNAYGESLKTELKRTSGIPTDPSPNPNRSTSNNLTWNFK